VPVSTVFVVIPTLLLDPTTPAAASAPISPSS
jgi:hypothetical protein